MSAANLWRKVTVATWERIAAQLPRPLDPEDAALDLSFLCRGGMLATPYARGDEWRGLGIAELAKRWGWPGEAGEGRARRLLSSPERWVDEELRNLATYRKWIERRAVYVERQKASAKPRLSEWERQALADLAEDDTSPR